MGHFFRAIYLGWFLSLAYACVLYLLDSYKRESVITVGVVFTAGVFATLIVAFSHQLFPILSTYNASGSFLTKVFSSFVKAAIPEEIVKLAVFFATAWTFELEDFSERFDGMLYMGMIGAGFGAYEDFSYIFSHTFSQGENISNALQFITWQRAFPGHILINSVSGYFLGRARFTNNKETRRRFLVAALLVAVLAHGLFNLAGSGGGAGWLIIYVLGLGRLFFFLRSDLFSRSPYRLIDQFYEGKNFYNWQLMEKWDYTRSIETYAQLYHRDDESSIGFFPLVISVIILYPVAISGVYYLNRLIANLVP